MGLPLTSGPVAFFVALDQGPAFAAGVALGSLAGALAECAFCLGYAYAAVHGRLAALAAATAAFAAVGAALSRLAPPLPLLAPLVVATLALTLRLMPSPPAPAAGPPLPRWDLPARMALTTALVVGLAESAPVLGPRPSGVLATFPAYAAVLAVFAHRAAPAAALAVLRGLLLGLFSFAAFFVVLAVLLERAGVGPAFAAAGAVTLAAHALSLRRLRAARVG